MKEIELRGWDGEKMHHIDLLSYMAHREDIQDEEMPYEARRNELMLFTGLHDKNGNKIFEGDIIKFDTTDLKTQKLQHEFINKVRYDYCRFVVTDPSSDIPYCIYDVRQHIEVIGNIWENPESLK